MNGYLINLLPSGWATTKLCYVVDVFDNHRIPVNAKDRAQRVGSVPYYGATGQVGWIDDYLFDEELILLGEDGAPFLDAAKSKAYLIAGKTWVNNHAHVLRGRCGVSNSFLLYQLNCVDYRPFVGGTTRLKLPQSQMRDIPIVLAPSAEQRRIVAEIEKHFTRLDAAVAALERVRANLKRYRASVLKAACEGRLVPTEAELARADGRDYEPAEKLLARILKERRARWEADQLAKMKAKGKMPKDDVWKRKYVEPPGSEICDRLKLPRGWAWTTLGALSWDSGYGTSERCDYSGEGPPVLRIPNIVDGALTLADLKFKRTSAPQNESDALELGDLLIVRTNGSKDLIGRAGLVKERFSSPHHFASYLIRFRLLTVAEVHKWIGMAWSTPQLRDKITAKAATSAGQYNVSERTLSAMSIPLPPSLEQNRIRAEVERQLSILKEVVRVIDGQLLRAARLRQSILKRAFEGKLVPQDPHDEPASVLLDRIRSQRAGEPGKLGEPVARKPVKDGGGRRKRTIQRS